MTEEFKNKMDYNDVANFFLAFANDKGEFVTNLKLQKLVFYSQAWYLANFSKPLFDDDFQAWVHGPVIPALYEKYKEMGSSPIVTDLKLKEILEDLSVTQADFLIEVAKIYMPYGGYELELMTHNETPWVEARGGVEPDERCTNIISKESIMHYYAKKIED